MDKQEQEYCPKCRKITNHIITEWENAVVKIITHRCFACQIIDKKDMETKETK